jgi:hypothetical protein
MLRKQQELADQRLIRREPNDFGVRCGESQADGIPCPGPDCGCDDCQRAYMVVPATITTKPRGGHA